MATNLRESGPPVVEDLFSYCYYYEFHQAVKLLELAFPEAHTLGAYAAPDQEALRIKSRVEYSYPSSDLFSLEKPAPILGEDFPCTMHINFLGIAGPNGPLPMPFSERLMERTRSGDTAFQDFLDLFNHRLLSILHRIRKKFWIGLDEKMPDQTDFASILFSLLGLGAPALRNRLAIPDRGLLYYTGLLWKKPRSAKGLEVFLAHYFNVPVKVTQFCGRWRAITPDQQTRIGGAGRLNTLGESAALGTRYWDTRSLIRVQVGPLDDTAFRAFLPGGATPHKALCDLIRFYLGKDYDFEVNLVMKASSVEESTLKKKTFLGWTSWLKKKPFTQDDGQVVLSVLDH